MNLDLVLGMSCRNISCLACDPTSSLAAHTASGVLVLLDTSTNCQVRYLHLRQNAVSTVNFSMDGKLVVTGEIGYRPAVRVWRVKDGQEVAALYGHEFGIKSVLFCANTTQIVSVGLEHDNVVNLWAWPEKHRLATNKIVDVIKAVAYSESASFFVTAGIRHLKFWYPDLSMPEDTGAVIPHVQCLYGRPGILEDCKQHTFVDVACGNGSSSDFIYCITKLGGLVIVNASSRLVHSHKNIQGFKANCLKAQDQILFIGFNSGDVHMFDAISLLHLAALPRPTFFRRKDMDESGVFTLVFNPSKTLLITAYKNSSMCVWDLKDASHVKQKYVAVYHSKAITNTDIFTTKDIKGNCRETLVTVSHDSTVRLWGVVIGESICYDQLSILYTDTTLSQPQTESESRSLDGAGIITAVKVSPDRKYIVTGNRAGSICVYDRITFEHTLTVMAHNREITCLAIHMDSTGKTILASGSRDRLIHIMDVNNDFRLLSTLSIHSSSITVMSICETVGMVSLISCSSDRTLSVCSSPTMEATSIKPTQMFHLTKCTTLISTPTDVCIDTLTEQVLVGCQDGYIRVLDLEMLQEQRMFKGCTCEERQIHKLCLDSKGVFLLSAASDRTINVLSFATGDILMTLAGHTKFVTGLIFTSSGDHVISTSMDGCVFIWHISEKALHRRLLKSKRQVQVNEEQHSCHQVSYQDDPPSRAATGPTKHLPMTRPETAQMNPDQVHSSNTAVDTKKVSTLALGRVDQHEVVSNHYQTVSIDHQEMAIRECHANRVDQQECPTGQVDQRKLTTEDCQPNSVNQQKMISRQSQEEKMSDGHKMIYDFNINQLGPHDKLSQQDAEDKMMTNEAASQVRQHSVKLFRGEVKHGQLSQRKYGRIQLFKSLQTPAQQQTCLHQLMRGHTVGRSMELVAPTIGDSLATLKASNSMHSLHVQTGAMVKQCSPRQQSPRTHNKPHRVYQLLKRGSLQKNSNHAMPLEVSQESYTDFRHDSGLFNSMSPFTSLNTNYHLFNSGVSVESHQLPEIKFIDQEPKLSFDCNGDTDQNPRSVLSEPMPYVRRVMTRRQDSSLRLQDLSLHGRRILVGGHWLPKSESATTLSGYNRSKYISVREVAGDEFYSQQHQTLSSIVRHNSWAGLSVGS